MQSLLSQLSAMTGVEIAGFALTIAAIWLAARNHWLTWPLQVLSGLLYVWLFAQVNLFGEAALNGLYIALALYGAWNWRSSHGDKPTVAISRMGAADHAVLWGVGLTATLLVGQMQVHFLPTDLPWLDSTVFVFGVLGQWLQARRKLENWPLWIILDLLSAAIYLVKGLQVTALLYVLLAGLAGYGWWDWSCRIRRAYA
ncbi:nicotinamide riboside transporter PnuC [Chitinimonas arctica]|nr:nicotinamide riboside transporter PnuC [Chitinimonas arctica]